MNGQLLFITIQKHETKVSDNGKYRIIVTDTNNRKYTHFVNEDDGNWAKCLTNDGSKVYVYVTEKPNPRNAKYPFKNIYKPNDPITTTAQNEPASDIPDWLKNNPVPPEGFFEESPPEQAQKEHVPYISDKDIKIRWMNSITNATHVVAELIDIKKHGEPEIKNLLINYANFFNDLESGMTMETIPVSKSQVIELHNRLIQHGISKFYYHNILEKILGKKVIKTTDLTYQQAAECLKSFDDKLNELNQEEPSETKTEQQVNFESNDDDMLPF